MDIIKPIPLKSVCLIFLGTLFPILVSVYIVLPLLLAKGVSFLVGYLICFQTTPFLLIFILSILLYKQEGNQFNWPRFTERMRLTFNGRILFRGIILFLFGLITYLLLQPVTLKLAAHPIFAPPSWFGPDLHPLKPGPSGSFMGMHLAGEYQIPVVYLIGWFLNIAGEELLFRGYLLPRMELSFNKRAWLINAICWWIWHCFWRWQMLALLPFILLLPLVAQKAEAPCLV